MGILLLKELLDKITLLFHLSSNQNIASEPARKYYHKTEKILRRLHTVFAVLIIGEDCDYQFEKSYEELGCFLDELRELFEAWNVLKSKVYLVLQVELLLSKVLCCSLEILHLLESCEQAVSVELNETSLEMCIQELKNVELEQMSTVLEDAMRCQEEGKVPNPESLLEVVESLNMSSNQELLIEMVALERLKEDAEQNGKNVEAVHIDKMVSLVAHMHDHVVRMKHSQSCYHVMVPSDFCCPLSLKLMADPVIVASGQTYEKAFIKKWIDMGLTMCPKTRQPLSHTNLIPNYTVKAFIANWCESNNIKLPDPVKIASLCVPSQAPPAPSNGESKDSYISHSSNLLFPKSAQCFSFLENGLTTYGVNRDGELPLQTGRSSLSESSGSSMVTSIHGSAIGRIPVMNSEDEVSIGVGTNIASEGEQSKSSLVEGYSSDMDDANSFQSPPVFSRTSDVGSSLEAPESSVDVSENSNGSRSDVCGEGASDERRASPYMATRRREPDFLSKFEPRSRSHSIWRRSSDRFVPKIVPSAAAESHPDHSAVEAQVRKLVEDLKSVSVDTQREASSELRRLTKDSMDNRIVIANCGAISILVDILYSTDTKTQEDAVTALLNLSINDNNKNIIANAGAIDPLIHVLEVGSSEAKENSAATLFSLSVMEDNKILIGKSGAIGPLVDLLRNGTPRGKKDAATALFNLSILHENKSRIVQTGAVRHLVGLMDPAAGMVDKAVAVLSNLATIPEGRNEIGQGGGIPVLVEVVELGSARGKENAAAALLQLCTHSSRFCNMVLQEGSVPPLVALSQSGTPRAKEKAQALLNCFRNQRGNAGRG